MDSSVRNQSGPSEVPYSIPWTSNWSGTFSCAVSYSKPTGSRVPFVKSYLIQSINLYFELEKNALLLGGSGHQSCNDGYMLLSVIKGKPSKAKDTFFKKLIPLFLHILYNIWNRWVENYTTYLCLININVLIRCLMVSTDQADPHCFYFRISWILMEWLWFYFFFCPLHLFPLHWSKISSKF